MAAWEGAPVLLTSPTFADFKVAVNSNHVNNKGTCNAKIQNRDLKNSKTRLEKFNRLHVNKIIR